MLKHALGSTLLVTATHALALTLGGTQGGVIIGRPIDILVSSSLDAADAASGLCLEAEVMYGDTRVPASAVTTAIHRLGQDGSGALRVRVSAPVNEPIVTLALKAGCQSSYRRTYTLLADFDAAPAPSPVPFSRDVTAPGSTGRVVSEAPARSTSGGARSGAVAGTNGAEGGKVNAMEPLVSGPQSAAAAEPVPSLVAESPVRLAAPARRPEGVVRLSSKSRPAPRVTAGQVTDAGGKQTVATPGGSRLKLDPIELSAAAGSVAATSKPNEQSAAPATPTAASDASSIPAPADSNAQASSSAPVAPETALQQELKALREEQSRLRLAVESVNSELKQAQSDRYSNPVVYGLGAAVLVLLGGVLYLLRRGRARGSEPQVWWNSSGVEATASDFSLPGAVAAPATPMSESDIAGLEAVEAGASVFQEVPIAEVDINTLLDLWQQTEFLQSIGQPFDALKALEAFVQQYPRASEAPYLRWLQLALQQGNERSLSQAQAAYEHHFHRLLPASATAANRNGLDSDRAFVQQLSAAWPGPEAQAQIDRALTSQPGDPSGVLQERNVRVFDDLIALRRLLTTLPELPADIASVLAASRAANAPAAEAAVASEADAAQWLSVGEVAEPQQAQPAVQSSPAQSMLELDLTPGAGASAQAEPSKAELPPLDFDFFEFDPATDKPGAAEDKSDKPA